MTEISPAIATTFAGFDFTLDQPVGIFVEGDAVVSNSLMKGFLRDLFLAVTVERDTAPSDHNPQIFISSNRSDVDEKIFGRGALPDSFDYTVVPNAGASGLSDRIIRHNIQLAFLSSAQKMQDIVGAIFYHDADRKLHAVFADNSSQGYGLDLSNDNEQGNIFNFLTDWAGKIPEEKTKTLAEMLGWDERFAENDRADEVKTELTARLIGLPLDLA